MSHRCLAALVVLVLAPTSTLALPDGWDDSSGCGGSGCHGAAGDAVVEISGPTTLMLGETARYTISFSPQLLIGTGIAAELVGGGMLDLVDPGTSQLVGGAVTHKARNAGVYSYEVDVTAPGAPGLISLQGAMLAYNDGNGADGDVWNVASSDITVEAPEPAQLGLALVGTLVLAPFGMARSRRRA